jgi:predicted ATP-binding protein involved in virulence
MRVKELKLHHFRGIKDLHLIFNTEQNVVVLVGINGVGKSSILNCIDLLVEYYRRVFYRSDFLSDLYFSSGLMSTSDIYTGTTNLTAQIKVNFKQGCDMEWKIAAATKDHVHPRWPKADGGLLEKIVRNNETDILNHYLYYLPNRQVLSLTISDNRKPEDIINFEGFSTWFKQTEDLENERRLSDNIEYRHPVLAAVRGAVYSLLGNGYNTLTFKREIDRMSIKKFGREIAVDLLSDGEKSLLAMVGHLSRKLAEYNLDLINPLEASAIVLIDEIELHLHPAWQRMIIPRLTQTFPNCQFIVTTHSPQVLSHVDPECIHILDYDGDNVVVKRPDSSYGLDSNRILEDILGVSKRPQEIQDRMSELFRTINNNDLEGAKEIVRELGEKIGISEPELVKAEATIKRREIIGR